jgi:hypothetical protein
MKIIWKTEEGPTFEEGPSFNLPSDWDLIEEPVEELSLDADEGLIEEVKTTTISPAYKGFGN